MASLLKTPKVTPPKPMPDMESPVVRESEDKKRRQIAARGGRASTMLSSRNGSGGGEAGTGAYKNSLLGQAG